MNRPSNLLAFCKVTGTITTIAVCMMGPTAAALANTTVRDSQASAFCNTNLARDVSKINATITNLQNKLNTAHSERVAKQSANYTKWDQDLQTNRTKWAQLRQEDFAKLMAKATTATEKTAVTTYETAITDAINTRETANDAAISAYRSSVANLITSQTATLNAQVSSFVGAVDSAEATAQASCQANPSQGPSIRITFQAALKTARQTYTSQRSTDAKLTSQIQALAQTRDTTIKTNNAVFLATAKNARMALQTAFKSSGANV